MQLPKWNDYDALMAFWRDVHFAPVKTARKLFPNRHEGYVSDTKLLSGAASNRAAELSCRRRGDEVAGDCYAMAVKVCFEDLTEWAKIDWRGAKWELL